MRIASAGCAVAHVFSDLREDEARKVGIETGDEARRDDRSRTQCPAAAFRGLASIEVRVRRMSEVGFSRPDRRSGQRTDGSIGAVEALRG